MEETEPAPADDDPTAPSGSPPPKKLLEPTAKPATAATGEGEAGPEASPVDTASSADGAAAAAASTGGQGMDVDVDVDAGNRNGGTGTGTDAAGAGAGAGAVDMDLLLTRGTPFGAGSGALALGDFEAGEDLKELLAEARVLVVGAGGLGCEILKNLALSGVKVGGCGLTGKGRFGRWVG